MSARVGLDALPITQPTVSLNDDIEVSVYNTLHILLQLLLLHSLI